MTETVQCPQCGSKRLFKSGFYRDRQRWLCRFCGFRFSESSTKVGKEVDVFWKVGRVFDSGSQLAESSIGNRGLSSKKVGDDSPFAFRENVVSHGVTIVGKDINRLRSYSCNHRVCATPRSAKNLEVKEEVEGHARATTDAQDVNGKTVQLMFHMQKQGYSPETIRMNRTALKVLTERGANLIDDESVKEVIAKQKWSDARRRNVINAYSLFLKFQGLTWDKPKCHVQQKFPFIPKEEELDQLVAGSGRRVSTMLQLLKETAMRAGEARRLEWIDIDFEKSTITLNCPEKNSSPRMWKVTQKLLGMLNNMPRENNKLFTSSSPYSLKTTFGKTRKRLAIKLSNPRLLRISFHTFRHWKATQLYHETKDPYYVKQFLGHKSLKTTEIYINIERTLFEPSSDNFTVRVTKDPEEIKSLLESGFEHVCEQNGLMFLRKRK